jgi:hypothetical protein
MSYDITEVRANISYHPRDKVKNFATNEEGQFVIDRKPNKVCDCLLVDTCQPNLHKYNFAAQKITLWNISLYGDMLTIYSYYVQGFLTEKHKKGKATLGFVHYADIDGVTVIPPEKSPVYLPTFVISVRQMGYALQKSVPRLVLVTGEDADLKRFSKAFLADFKAYLAENPSKYADELAPLLAALPEKAKLHGLNLGG